MARKCQATNQSGAPCSAAHYRDGWCRWHHPDLDAERRAYAAKGGRSRSNAARAAKRLPADAMTVDDVRGVLGQAIRATLAGELEPGVANAVANLSRVALAADEQAALARLSDRVAELEAQAT